MRENFDNGPHVLLDAVRNATTSRLLPFFKVEEVIK
jgi:hypothetical protein